MIDPRVLELSRRLWRRDPSQMNFETSVGMLAWVGEPGDVFERDGEVVGWARLDPAYERIRSDDEWDVAPPLLTWLAENVSVLEQILDAYESGFHTKHAAADLAAADVLRRRGFTEATDEPFGIYLSRDIGDEPKPTLEGYRFIYGVTDPELRAQAHRAGWPDTSRTAEDWAEVMRRPEYNVDFDVVVLAGHEPVGAALMWVDEYAEFEPVGVSPDHRGRGVAQAMLRFGLHLASDAGVKHALVGARGDDAYPGPRALYRSVGFAPISREVIVSP